MKQLVTILMTANLLAMSVVYYKMYSLYSIVEVVALEMIKFDNSTKAIEKSVSDATKKVDGLDKKLEEIKKKLGKGLF